MQFSSLLAYFGPMAMALLAVILLAIYQQPYAGGQFLLAAQGVVLALIFSPVDALLVTVILALCWFAMHSAAVEAEELDEPLAKEDFASGHR